MQAQDKAILSPSTSLCLQDSSTPAAPFTLLYQEHLTPTTATEGLSRLLEALLKKLKTEPSPWKSFSQV